MNHRICGILAAVAITTLPGCTPDEARSADGSIMKPSHHAAPPAPTSETMALAAQHSIVVHKTATCRCCQLWVDHMKEHGFQVEVRDTEDLASVKAQHGTGSEDLMACHTSVVGDYVVEGHVPADVILKLLEEKPAIAGIAVPGMPIGSPGMEGSRREAYDVIAFDRNGGRSVFASR